MPPLSGASPLSVIAGPGCVAAFQRLYCLLKAGSQDCPLLLEELLRRNGICPNSECRPFTMFNAYSYWPETKFQNVYGKEDCCLCKCYFSFTTFHNMGLFMLYEHLHFENVCQCNLRSKNELCLHLAYLRMFVACFVTDKYLSEHIHTSKPAWPLKKFLLEVVKECWSPACWNGARYGLVTAWEGWNNPLKACWMNTCGFV